MPYFYPAFCYGGIVRLAYELACELVRMGNEVTVITTDVLDENNRHSVQPGVVQDIDGVRAYYCRNLSNGLAYRHQLFLPTGVERILKGLDNVPDIIHMHGHRNILNNIIRRYAVKNNIPYIMTPNGTAPNIERKITAKRIFDIFLGDRVLRDSAGFVAVSKAEIKQFDEMGINREKVELIYNGLDMNSFSSLPPRGVLRKKLGIAAEDPVILYMGKITPRKGVEFLVEAVAGEPDWKLVIAGNDMGFKNVVRSRVKEFGIESRVYFTGLLIDDMRLSAYVDADVCVYPSTLEIFGLVPFEALMCGTPVVVCEDCGCGEIIGEAKAGQVIPYAVPEALRKSISETISNKQESENMVKSGREFIEANLPWPVIAQQTEKFYEKVSIIWQES